MEHEEPDAGNNRMTRANGPATACSDNGGGRLLPNTRCAAATLQSPFWAPSHVTTSKPNE